MSFELVLLQNTLLVPEEDGGRLVEGVLVVLAQGGAHRGLTPQLPTAAYQTSANWKKVFHGMVDVVITDGDA